MIVLQNKFICCGFATIRDIKYCEITVYANNEPDAIKKAKKVFLRRLKATEKIIDGPEIFNLHIKEGE